MDDLLVKCTMASLKHFFLIRLFVVSTDKSVRTREIPILAISVICANIKGAQI